MAAWKLNYGIQFRGNGPKEMKCNVTEKSGNGFQIVMGGDIPDSTEFSAEDAAELAESVANLSGVDGLPASDIASHVKSLKAIASFCEQLISKLEG